VSAGVIESLSLQSLALAFAAGLVSFLSPCVLPLLPVYLSYISGVAVDALDLQRRRVLRVSLAFVLGFTILFVVLGTAAGGIGQALLSHRTLLSILAGLVLVLAGVAAMDLVHLPGVRAFPVPKVAGFGGAMVAGAAVAVGWTPCVGPVLGAILTYAGSRASGAGGALLLFAYSAGLGVPFILASVAFGWVSRRLAAVRRHYRTVRLVAGALLIVAGLLMITGAFDVMSRSLPSWVPFDI
jgi:cytochrome c-type biogenesis protein